MNTYAIYLNGKQIALETDDTCNGAIVRFCIANPKALPFLQELTAFKVG